MVASPPPSQPQRHRPSGLSAIGRYTATIPPQRVKAHHALGGALIASAEKPDGEGNLKPPIVLVVEDEVLIRMAVSDYLRECGYSVIEAGNAAEALTVLDTPVQVDAVLTDFIMPGEMDGFGLARWIRANRPGVEVVIASGVQRKAEKAGDICEDGPDIVKPYDHRDVERRIRALLEARRGSEE